MDTFSAFSLETSCFSCSTDLRSEERSSSVTWAVGRALGLGMSGLLCCCKESRADAAPSDIVIYVRLSSRLRSI